MFTTTLPNGRELPVVTDEQMRSRLAEPATFTIHSKPYTLGLLRRAEREIPDDAAAQLVWEHMRRMIALGEEGTLVALLAGTQAGDPDWGGLCVFDASADEAGEILAADPLVSAGLCTFEIHPASGFPGTEAGARS